MNQSTRTQNLEKLTKQERMAKALRENLFKRKQQQRERSERKEEINQENEDKK